MVVPGDERLVGALAHRELLDELVRARHEAHGPRLARLGRGRRELQVGGNRGVGVCGDDPARGEPAELLGAKSGEEGELGLGPRSLGALVGLEHTEPVGDDLGRVQLALLLGLGRVVADGGPVVEDGVDETTAPGDLEAAGEGLALLSKGLAACARLATTAEVVLDDVVGDGGDRGVGTQGVAEVAPTELDGLLLGGGDASGGGASRVEPGEVRQRRRRCAGLGRRLRGGRRWRRANIDQLGLGLGLGWRTLRLDVGPEPRGNPIGVTAARRASGQAVDLAPQLEPHVPDLGVRLLVEPHPGLLLEAEYCS